jgi:polyisoprenoid-binding protein YceI
MKKGTIIFSAFLLLTAFTTLTTFWKSDAPHSQLGFTVTHMGIADVSGTFNDFTVTIESDKADFSDASIEMTAQVASIDTRVEARNNHLKSADFFDAAKYPTLYFKSTGLTKTSANEYKLKGNLTLHGITKEVTMDLLHRGTIEDPKSKKKTAGFQVIGVIKRSDFNLGSGFPDAAISDEVRIKADGEFKQQ